MPLPKDFPTAADFLRVEKEHEFFRLYDCQPLDFDVLDPFTKFVLKEFFEGDTPKAKILDRALNVAPTVVDTMTDFLLGEPFQIQLDGKDGTGEVEKPVEERIEGTQLRRKAQESSALLQTIGHTHFKLYRDDDGKARIEEVPYSYYFPDWSNVNLGAQPTIHRVVSYLNGPCDGVTSKRYIYVEEYRMENKQAVIEKSLWEDNAKKIGKQVPLSTLNITFKGTETNLYVVEQTGLDELPLVSLHARKTTLHRYGQSVLKVVKPQLLELNDRLRQLSSQFLKHLNAKLQIPEGTVVRNTDGTVANVNMEVLIARSGDPDAKYITNENPLIEQAFDYIDKLLRLIAKQTQTPSLVEDEKGGVETAEALRVRMMPLLKKVRFFEQVYDPAIKAIVRIASKIEGAKDAKTLEKLRLIFDRGLPKDWLNDVTVWGDALASGLASQDKAVRMFQGIEGDELKEELEKIKAKE